MAERLTALKIQEIPRHKTKKEKRNFPLKKRETEGMKGEIFSVEKCEGERIKGKNFSIEEREMFSCWPMAPLCEGFEEMVA